MGKHPKLCHTKCFHSFQRKAALILTTNLLLTFSRICFSFSAMASPFRFFIRFFSNLLHAYIFPVARTWHAHTWQTTSRRRDLFQHTLLLHVNLSLPWLTTSCLILYSVVYRLCSKTFLDFSSEQKSFYKCILVLLHI